MRSEVPDSDELSALIAQASQGALPTRPAEPVSEPPPNGRKAGFLAVLMVVLISSTAWISIEANREPNPFTQEREENGLRAMMLITIETLEEHLGEFGRYPSDLVSVALDEEEYSYRLVGNTFELIGRLPHRNLEVAFQSGDDLTPFVVAMESTRMRNQT